MLIDHSTKKGIFADADLQAQFHENGYVIVPFLSSDEVEKLYGLYEHFYPNGVEGFFTTTFANNVEHRETVNRSIREVCADRINELFEEYKILFSSFIVKAPGENSELIMHQDMTLVDEDFYSGINIWCPLVDLTEKNGAIEVLPKSHRFFKTYRGSSLPDIYDDIVAELKPLMQAVYLKAGEAVIFDQSIIHYSPPNRSDSDRPVINTFVTHQDARLKICYLDRENVENQVEIFEQEDDFIEQFENFGHNIFNRPTIGKSLGLFPYDFPKLTMEKVKADLGIEDNSKPKFERKSWLSRLIGIK